jgi:hypothetical protein
MPSLIDQARFKPSELALAVDRDHGSRYLIGPRREIAGKRQRFGIASGLLGGFGGFVARVFRDHDYQLGRQNCQDFLLREFAVPDNHPIVQNWPVAVDKSKFVAMPDRIDEAKKATAEAAAADGNETQKKAPSTYYCLVPLYGTAKDSIELPSWPQIAAGDVDRLMSRIGKRFDAVAPLLVQQNVRGVLGMLLGLVLQPGIRSLPGLVRDKALSFVRLTILGDLVRRDQIEGWELPRDLGVDPDDARLVIAELLDPKFDERNVEGIRKAVAPMSSSLGKDKNAQTQSIEQLLERLKQARGKPYRVWEAPWKDKNGGRLFTLESRKPNIVSASFAYLGVGFFEPTVDSPGV